MSIKNPRLGVDFFGSPHEILEAARTRSLAPRKLGSHPDTDLSFSEVFKDEPEMSFSGDRALAVLELLGSIQQPDLRNASSIIDRHAGLLTGREASVRIPLLAAAAAGRPDAVDLLLRKGAHVDGSTQFDMSPLHWAAAKGHRKVIVRLLDGGADAGRLSWFYVTAMELAALNGHREVVHLMAARTKTKAEGVSVERIVQRMGLIGD